MGTGISLEAIDPSHKRIYANLLQIKNVQTRAQMIQTCALPICFSVTIGNRSRNKQHRLRYGGTRRKSRYRCAT